MDRDPDNTPPSPHLEGRYTNYVEIGHSGAEFVLDCGQRYGDSEPPRFHTRLVMVPLHALDLLELLERSIGQYERDHGAISRQPGDER